LDFINGELTAYCMMVQRGKPAANLPIHERYVVEATRIIAESYELRCHKEYLSDGWVSLWIYKYPHILDVIKALPQTPQTSFEHWVLGKLFGYDENSISEFLDARHE